VTERNGLYRPGGCVVDPGASAVPLPVATAPPAPVENRDQELTRRRREMEEAHRALDDAGAPRRVGDVDLSLAARVGQLRRSAMERAREEVRATLASYLEGRAGR